MCLRRSATNANRVAAHPPEKVEAPIQDDAETLTLWREATTAKPHVHVGDGDNVTIKPERGNARAYTLARLKRERSDLFKQVTAGKLSANAAAITAGWRKKLTPLDTAIRAFERLARCAKSRQGGEPRVGVSSDAGALAAQGFPSGQKPGRPSLIGPARPSAGQAVLPLRMDAGGAGREGSEVAAIHRPSFEIRHVSGFFGRFAHGRKFGFCPERAL
jgi:hypothetical protein